MEKQEIKENLANCNQWKRLIYMLLFAIVLYFTMLVLSLVVVVQIVFSLITGKTNENIQGFSQDLASYINQIVLFLSYNVERKPYPFNPLQQEENVDIDDEVDEHVTSIEDASSK